MKRPMKHLTCLVLVSMLLLGPLGSGATPARAQFPSGSPASLMPADTSFYVELDTSNLPGLLDKLAALVGRAGFPLNRQFLLASLDSGLRDMIQGMSFSQDVMPWLGPTMAAGVVIPDDLPAGQNPFPVEQGVFVVTVTDDVEARGFLEKFVANVEARGVELERTETTLYGEKVIGYAYEPTNIGLAWMPGYLTFGPLSTMSAWYEHLNSGGAVLADQPEFTAVWGQFRPGSLVKGYVDGGLLGTLLNAAMQNQNYGPQERAILSGMQLFRAFKAFGFALRGEGRTLSFDLYGSIDTALEAQAMDQAGLPPFSLNPNGGALADRIPADAFAVIDWGDLAGVLNYLRNIPDVAAQVDMAAEQLKAETQIDLDADVLSWLGGEFAMYITLDVEGMMQGGSSSPQYAWTLLVAVDDPAPVRGLLGKLETLFTGLAADVKPNPFTKLAEDLYAIDSGDPSTGKVTYGLLNDTFMLTLGTGQDAAMAAARGDGVLGQTPVWQHVVEEVPAFNQPVFFLNLDALNAMLDAAMQANTGMSDPSFNQIKGILSLFEGALIYGSDQGGGNVFASAALLLREPLP